MDADGWIARNVEHESSQPARLVRTAFGIVPRYGALNRSAVESGDSDKCALLVPGTPLFSWQPRASAAYKLSDNTALHAGGGVFNDIIPAQIADLGATNAPYAPVFVGGINGQVGGAGIAPGVANSAVDATAAANRSFQTAFSAGNATPYAVNLNTFPSGKLKTPYFLQWSLGVERELALAARCAWITSARGPSRSHIRCN